MSHMHIMVIFSAIVPGLIISRAYTLQSTIREVLLVRVWPVIAQAIASAIWLYEYM